MAYEAPTVDDFNEKFPEFAEQETPPDEDQIQAAIDTAMRSVDETWLEGDYQEAILQLAAHLLAANTAGAGSLGQDDLKALSIGPLSLTFGDKLKTSDYSTTTYGQTYASLLKKNHPAILVV